MTCVLLTGFFITLQALLMQWIKQKKKASSMTCMEYLGLYMVMSCLNNLYVHINQLLSLILHGYSSIDFRTSFLPVETSQKESPTEEIRANSLPDFSHHISSSVWVCWLCEGAIMTLTTLGHWLGRSELIDKTPQCWSVARSVTLSSGDAAVPLWWNHLQYL